MEKLLQIMLWRSQTPTLTSAVEWDMMQVALSDPTHGKVS